LLAGFSRNCFAVPEICSGCKRAEECGVAAMAKTSRGDWTLISKESLIVMS
jgi:hypothetical protein